MMEDVRGVWCVRGECMMHSGVMVVMFIVVNCGRGYVCYMMVGMCIFLADSLKKYLQKKIIIP
jgi:hypothetical protein